MKGTILKAINLTFQDKERLGANLFFLFSSVYLLFSYGDHSRVKTFALTLALTITVVFFKQLRQPFVWYVFLALFLLDLIINYHTRANHHFMLVYLTMAYIMYLNTRNIATFTTNVKWLLFILLFFASVQKLMSSEFVSGNFYYYMINTGKFFKPLAPLDQTVAVVISNNNALIETLNHQDPNQYGTVSLNNILPNIASISKWFAWATIALEFLAGLLIVRKPEYRFTHIIFVILILGISATRLESGFLGLLCISGHWLCNNTIIRKIYVVLTVIFTALTISQLGFY
ncbi:MAG TPA: hypothetical protein PKL92_02935 [Aquaticitalea sp.]|nr:hypothetical protein [Aquaticitalea sp.]